MLQFEHDNTRQRLAARQLLLARRRPRLGRLPARAIRELVKQKIRVHVVMERPRVRVTEARLHVALARHADRGIIKEEPAARNPRVGDVVPCTQRAARWRQR
jgi:hypothetical protein